MEKVIGILIAVALAVACAIIAQARERP